MIATNVRPQFSLRSLRSSLALLALLMGIVLPVAHAQQSTGDAPGGSQSSSPTSSMSMGADQDQEPDLESAEDRTNSSANATGDADDTLASANTQNAALPADQIIQILQDNPDVTAQLKTLLAQQLQQQGQQVSADQISDDQLDQQIQSSAALRTSITTFLHARGLVSDEDMQRAALTGDDTPGSDTSVQGLGMIPGQSTRAEQALANRDAASDAKPENGAQTEKLQAANGEAQKTRSETAHASTDLPQVHHVKTPYKLPSMHDLYTQIPENTVHLKRFGADVFLNRGMNSAVSPMRTTSGPSLDMPVDPSYVLGPGDSLSVNLWGGISQTITRIIDRDGRIFLPEAGSVEVAGMPLEQAQKLITNALKSQYRDAQIAVTMGRLRAVRVYVVGDVQRPGAYNLSSLATAVSALYAAGGSTNVGSLRTVYHYRGKELVRTVDLYDFLLHGIRSSDDHFQEGDTLLVPPAGPQVALSGSVKRPAIYELSGTPSLADVLNDAGGATVAASLSHITVERIDANHRRETVTLPLSAESDPQASKDAISRFVVHDGDRIDISPILPYSEKIIYVEGHVVRPGRLPYHDGMRLSDALHSYQDLLPEPADRGEVVRLVSPDLHADIVDFNVPDVLVGNSNIPLQPFDTIRIFGRYQKDAPRVKIGGEVLRPGIYPMSNGMTVSQLVRLAGGFKRDALLDSADLTSYTIDDAEARRLPGVHPSRSAPS